MKWFSLILIVLFCSCGSSDETKKVLISMYYPNNDYQKWLKEGDSQLDFYQAYGMEPDSLMKVLQTVDAILLTGGKDIDPSSFGMTSLRELCSPIDPYRDSIEFALVEHAFDMDIPLFGACRGMQVINVKRGGSLIVDLPSMKNTSIHQQDEGDSEHLLIDAGLDRWLYADIPPNSKVNSNHHQAIDRLAEGFQVLSYAEDSVIEAMIWTDTTTGPEVFCWQWHPERMQRSEPYAIALREKILSITQANKDSK